MIVLVFLASLLFATPAEAVPAKRASEFLNSICVNTKMQQGQIPANIIIGLNYTGINCYRDALGWDFNVYQDVYNQTGAKIDGLIGTNPGANATPPATTQATQIEFLMNKGRALAQAGILFAVEGPNEPNNFGFQYGCMCGKGTTSWHCVSQFMKDFMRVWNADPVTDPISVIGVSETGAQFDNQGLQFNRVPNVAPPGVLMSGQSLFADIANVHNYPCCYHKGSSGTVTRDNIAWDAAANNEQRGPFDGWYANHMETWRGHFLGYTAQQSPNILKVTTEGGWTTNGTPAEDDLQAKMILNMLLAQFAQGWKATFIYELIDTGNGFGLYKRGVDFGPRPAAHAVHRLTEWLADANVAFLPGNAAVTVLDVPAFVHSILLRKFNGRFELIVWGEKATGTVTQQVQLGKVYARVGVYDPLIHELQDKGTASSVSLELGLGPKVVEFYD